MFDFSTGAGVPFAHWGTTGGLFNRYYSILYRHTEEQLSADGTAGGTSGLVLGILV